MNIKKFLTISLILVMMTSKNTIIAFAESNDTSDTTLAEETHDLEDDKNNDKSADTAISGDTEDSEDTEATGKSDGTVEENTDNETENTDDAEDIEDAESTEKIEDDEPHEASISIRGLVPTVVVNDDGYLSEKYCVYYESSFNAYDEMTFSEAFSILINSKNDYCDAEKSVLRSLDISGICPDDLSIDVFYNKDETEVTKIKASYTSVDDNKEKIHVTLYEKDIK